MVAKIQNHADRIAALSEYLDALVDVATGGRVDDARFVELRGALLSDPVLKARLPGFVARCRSVNQYWNFIKCQFDTYKERREFLWGHLNPLINELEDQSGFPSDVTADAVIGKLDRAYVHEHWQRAIARRDADPPAAITAARSLLESVCKAILHEAGEPFEEGSELPKLYGKVAALLNLAPGEHSERIFKQVLGGCHAVVEGLGAIRSRDGDAHGSSPTQYRAKPRHAQLAVNLAGATATFLIETWEERRACERHCSDNRDAAEMTQAN